MRKIMTIFTSVVMLCQFCSCVDRSMLKGDYESLRNSIITIPRDLYNHNAQTKKCRYNLVVYRDSSSCSPCYVKSLDEWKGFLSEFRKGEMGLIFVLQPVKSELPSLKAIIKNRHYDFPVYVDTTGCFMGKNKQIPKDRIFHCMLLDNNNQVVVVGNPLKNKDVNKIMVEYVFNN